MKVFRTEYLVIAVSLFVTALISCVFGIAGRSIHGSFSGWFWITFLIQILGFFAWNSFLIQKENGLIQTAQIQALEQFSKFAIKISCAYCNHQNVTPIQLNQRNTFECESCKQVNSIHMQFISATMTTPIESVKIPLPDSESFAEFKVSPLP